MRISDWSSDVCSSDLEGVTEFLPISSTGHLIVISDWLSMDRTETQTAFEIIIQLAAILAVIANYGGKFTPSHIGLWQKIGLSFRSEEHTSELQSLMRISYAVFCLKKKKKNINHIQQRPTDIFLHILSQT